MRKIALFAAAAMVLLASCAKEELPSASADAQQLVRKTLEVGLDNSLTKTALGTELAGKFPVVWTEGDEIAVVENLGTQTQKYSTYRLLSGAGTSQGTFEYVSGDAYPAVIKDVVYPASAMKPTDVDLSELPGRNLNSLIPLEQNYTKDSFDPKAAVMHFHSDVEAPIVLKPAASIVCIPLKGKPGDIVTSIRWQHIDGHTRTFDLICPKGGIELSDQVTNFYIAVRPMYYDAAKGNTKTAANCIVKVNLANGAVQVKTPSNKKIKAGEFHRFPEWTLSKKSKWTFMYIGSERDDATWHQIPMGPAKYMIDGDDRSWWEFRRKLNSAKTGAQMAGPHKFIIDMGCEEQITGIKFKSKHEPSSPTYGITYNKSGKTYDIWGSQSYNPPYRVYIKFVQNQPTQEEIDSFKATSAFNKETGVATYQCTAEKGIDYYYGELKEKWWEIPLNEPVTGRYILMHVVHGWNNTGDKSAASMLKIAEFDIY